MFLSLGSLLRCLAILCAVLLLAESGESADDAWGRRRSNRRRRRAWSWRRRRKPVAKKVTACPRNTHVVSLTDSLHAAVASKLAYHARVNKYSRVSLPNRFNGMAVGTTGYRIRKVVDLHGINLKAFVADKVEWKNGKRLKTRMIVFRGTNGAKQLVKQFKQGFKNVKNKEHSLLIGKTHWVKVLTFTRDGNRVLMNRILPYIKDPTYRYIITGHSLGGALASLFGLVAKFKPGTQLYAKPGSCIITFGAPRLGNRAFANLHDKLISPTRKIRFVYKRDIVPHVPVTIAGESFVHHSREVWIATQYLLQRNWRNFFSWSARRTSGWRVCPDKDYDVQKICSNGLPWSYLTRDHGMKHYVRSLIQGVKKNHVPTKFEDKNKKPHSTWAEAWRCSNVK